MRLIKTEDAVGHVLCHDMTQIIKDQYKDARFRKGHVVTEEDIPVLLSMGKENLYVWEMTPGMVHENDAAERLLDVWLAQQDYRVKELPVAHLERQHWGRKIAAFLLRKMGIKNDRTAR